MELVDTHCHIHFNSYKIPVREVVTSARRAGVGKMICVGCSLGDSQKAVELAAKYKNVWASVGAHPHDGKDYLNDPKAKEKLNDLLAQPKVVACGEIGLDYYHEHTKRADQKKILRQQIEVAMDYELPFIFHVRDAFDDFFEIVDEYKISNGVVHSFSATKTELKGVLKRGFYVSLNGIMTFTNNADQLEAAKMVPKNRLLLETDAPFLTPKPHRGKICEPKHVKDIARFLAELRDEPLEELAKYTSANARKLFNI